LIFDNPVGQGNALVITKQKEQQKNILNASDFQAICITMKALDESFAFYNSGDRAGARQNHKHVHVMPLESISGKKIPVDERVKDELYRAEQSSQPASTLTQHERAPNYRPVNQRQSAAGPR